MGRGVAAARAASLRAAIVAIVAACVACGSDSTSPNDSHLSALPIVGADISSLTAVEHAGAQFYAKSGAPPGNAIGILANSGVNLVRLRLFHAPDTTTERVNTLAYDIALAQRAKQFGMKLLLDIHYSDTWADPGHQAIPAAWQSLDSATLVDSVRAYTHDVIAAFKSAGVLPDMVQLGNEVNTGFLWPAGYANDVDADWSRYAALLQAARDGLQSSLGSGDHVLVVHHVADPRAVEWHMDHLLAHISKPDIIGVSYYPMWHGDFQAARAALATVATKYGLPILIAETSYPWTDQYFDNYADAYHGSPAAGMPPYTPLGQSYFVDSLAALVRSIPNNQGLGFVYWEPAWLPGNTFGSPMDNQALFDQHGYALPALSAIAAARGQ